MIGIILVFGPTLRVEGDVFSDAVEICLISDDVVVIIPLPGGEILSGDSMRASRQCSPLTRFVTKDLNWAIIAPTEPLLMPSPWPAALALAVLGEPMGLGEPAARPYGLMVIRKQDDPVKTIRHDHKII